MTSQDVILGILMKKNLTGYDIKHELETIFSYFYNASYGTIYPTLSKMEKEGLITKQCIVQEGKPNKNVYTITAEGKERFLAYLQSEIVPTEFKSDFMVRMFFGALVEPGILMEWIERAIRDQQAELTALREDYIRYKPSMSISQEITIQMGIEHSQGNVRVLTEGLERIKNVPNKKE
jgi:DNA-binding PadR family transcriptional regulator